MFFTKNNRDLSSSFKKIEEIKSQSIELIKKFKEYHNLIEEKQLQLRQIETEIKIESDRKASILTQKEDALRKIFDEKSIGFPWLASAIAEYYKFFDEEIANYLDNKSHPAHKKAYTVREVATDNASLRKQLKIARNFVEYYETLFPWITEYVGNDLDELLESINSNKFDDDEDPVLQYVPRSEFNKLSTIDRNQKALDRYLSSRKKPWEIGRDYERYIGYLYEQAGYSVVYIGIEKGLEDLGRDLICQKGDKTEIIQCKCWANHKVIHEKHINQLYGTTVKYYIDNQERAKVNNKLLLFPDLFSSGRIKASLITSTSLSDTARKFSDALGINYVENKLLGKYPLIKCNISSSGEKIYHLPFDQQYDRTLIKNAGEFYASTVAEAEKKGFRRAIRWKGDLT